MRWSWLGGAVACLCALAADGRAGGLRSHAVAVGVTARGEAPPDRPSAERPLHEVVDDLLSRASRVMEGSLANDADFLRRVSLDLLGMPPTSDEVRSFLSDDDPEKREHVVDRALNDPRFARHVATLLSVMLLERRTSRFIAAEEWERYLWRAIRRNRPLNEVISEVLSADGTDEATRAAAQFYIAREGDPHLITRDVGRIIFGRDMECAQCHDHPLIEDYLQRDYHALLAVFKSGTLITKKVGDKEVAFYGERVGKDDVYESVFIDGKHVTGPRLPGEAVFEEPLRLPGADREVRSEHADVPKPVVSRRGMLARAATDGANRAFNENLANRLWAHMMGRGLVHPVDLHYPANPPTHPELLRVLGEQLAAMKFNVRIFLREIALTQAYQRSIDPPQPSEHIAVRAETLQRGLVARMDQGKTIFDASAAEYESAREPFEEIEMRLLPAVEDFAAKRTAMGAAVQKYEEAKSTETEIAGKLALQSEALVALRDARDKAALALEKLSQDETLAAAAKTIGERADALAREMESLQKHLKEKHAAVEPLTAEKAAATEAAQAAIEVLAPLKQETRGLEEVCVAARERMMDDFAAYWRCKQQCEQLDTVAAWNRSRRELAEARAEVAAHRASLQERVRESSECLQAVEKLSARVALTKTQLEAASALLREIEGRVASIDDLTNKLAAALSTVDEVNSSLTSGDSLDAAATHIESTIADLRLQQTAESERYETARTSVEAARERLASQEREVDQAKAELAALETGVQTVRSVVADAQSRASDLAAATDEKWRTLTETWSAEGAIRPLVHLSPEQLCWGMLQATGVYERTWQQQAAELDKERPLDKDARVSPFVWLARDRAIEERTYEKLKENVRQFVRIYGVGAGQPQVEFFASAEQALFVSNGSAVNGWTAPGGDNVTARMLRAKEPADVAEELYLGVLSRLPSDEEIAAVAAYMDERPEDQREAAARELVWGLLTSAEFRFNH